MPNLYVGGPQPVSGSHGLDRPYQDGIFIRSQFLENIKIEDRENELILINLFGEKLGVSKQRPGERYMIPTLSNLAVGDVNDAVTTSGYSFPDYLATDSPTITQSSTFSRQIGSGASYLGIPLPLQQANEGQVELMVNQYRGVAMVFTKRFIEQALGWIKNPTAAYSKKVRYAIMNDIEEYCWLSFLYTGPITAVADDYGTGANAFTDAIGVTNRANYALTRTLTSINGASNLITPHATGTSPGMSNTGNAKFSTHNVPWLFGSTASDISYDTVTRLSRTFNQRNIPQGTRAIACEPKGYDDISHLPQFVDKDVSSGNGVNDTGLIGGKIHGFKVGMSNVIQAAGASSNILYELAGTKGVLAYELQREPNLIIDNKLNKPELALIVMATTRYGAVVKRPDHAAVIQTRISP